METFLDRLVKVTPVAAMVRVALENILAPQDIDRIFRQNAVTQSERVLLFSSVVTLMCNVVCRVKSSVNAAYTDMQDLLGVSLKSVYNKLNHVEPEVCRQLVVQTATKVKQIIDEMEVREKSPIPGYEVRILDGNHHPASQRRIKELRDVAAGPLPGHTLVVLDPIRKIIVDCVPCEDGHTQERALVPELLEHVEKDVVWIADRNFCTCTMMFELAKHGAYFVIRRHAQTSISAKGDKNEIGRCDTGILWEQEVEVNDSHGNHLPCRLVTIELDEPTRDGDCQMQLLTNLPKSVSASCVASSYRDRWQVEAANLELVKHFDSEQVSLGHPPATLFAFSVSLVAYNLVRVVQASLRATHGEKATAEKISNFYLARAITEGWTAMSIVDDAYWTERYSNLAPRELALELKSIAENVKLERFLKSKRGPKKPPTPRVRHKGATHVSTKRLLDESKKPGKAK